MIHLCVIHKDRLTYQTYVDKQILIFVCADLSTKESGMTYPLWKCIKKSVRFFLTSVDILKFLLISGSADVTTITTCRTNSEHLASKF